MAQKVLAVAQMHPFDEVVVEIVVIENDYGLVEQPELLLGESLKEFLHGAVTSGQYQNGIAEVPELLFALCHVVCHNDFVKTVL